MSVESWDADQAVMRAPDDSAGSVGAPSCRRYGVTTWEALHHEPLALALAQEIPDALPDPDAGDDEWTDIDEDDPFAGRLLADEDIRDDDYGRAVVDVEDFAPEELAMHIIET